MFFFSNLFKMLFNNDSIFFLLLSHHLSCLFLKYGHFLLNSQLYSSINNILDAVSQIEWQLVHIVVWSLNWRFKTLIFSFSLFDERKLYSINIDLIINLVHLNWFLFSGWREKMLLSLWGFVKSIWGLVSYWRTFLKLRLGLCFLVIDDGKIPFAEPGTEVIGSSHFSRFEQWIP